MVEHAQVFAQRGRDDVGLTKSFVYGGIIALSRLLQGAYRLPGGSRGRVGRATTEAVVYASIAILISNFFLTAAMEQLCIILGL